MSRKQFIYTTFWDSAVFPSNTLIQRVAPRLDVIKYTTVILHGLWVIHVSVGMRDSDVPSLTGPSRNRVGLVSLVSVHTVFADVALLNYTLT